jgi:hypothetical protein
MFDAFSSREPASTSLENALAGARRAFGADRGKTPAVKLLANLVTLLPRPPVAPNCRHP